MDSITEEHIEKFVRFPELLSKGERRQIEVAISNSEELQKLAKWFRQFYRDLDEQESEAQSFVTRMSPVNFDSKVQGGDQVILAAKSKVQHSKVQLETIETFSSSEQDTIIRLLKNNENGKYQFHLLREKAPSKDELTILSLESVNIDFVVDKSRHISFRPEGALENQNWSNADLFLRLPLGQFLFPELEFGPKLFKGIIVEGDEKKVSIRQKSSEKNEKVTRVVIEEDGEYKVYRFGVKSELRFKWSNITSQNIWLFQ